MQDMQYIQKTLATPMHEDLEMDSMALDSELDLLLMDDEEEITATIPVSVNSR